MKTAIYGCGAMGVILGAFLTKSGISVDLIDADAAQVSALNTKGSRIVGFADMTVPVSALTPDAMRDEYDLIFLLTKQTANAAALPALRDRLHPSGTVCTLQNGVPELSVAKVVGASRTVGGTALWGATYVAPGVSELTQDITKNDHLFEIGEMDGVIGERIRRVAGVLEVMGPILITGSLMNSRWGKLVNNACMSGMSAACGFTFGEVLDNPKSLACLSYLGREVKRCCEAAGHALPVLLGGNAPDCLAFTDQQGLAESGKMFLRMYDGLRTAKASMLQDLEKGKKTEVLAINGFVSDTGDACAVDTPFNDTVIAIITGIEKGELPRNASNLDLFAEKLFL